MTQKNKGKAARDGKTTEKATKPKLPEQGLVEEHSGMHAGKLKIVRDGDGVRGGTWMQGGTIVVHNTGGQTHTEGEDGIEADESASAKIFYKGKRIADK